MAIERYRAQPLTLRDSYQLRSIRAEAVKSAERVHGLAFVTGVALHHAGALTSMESTLIGMFPMVEARFKMLTDNFVLAAVTELQRLGWS